MADRVRTEQINEDTYNVIWDAGWSTGWDEGVTYGIKRALAVLEREMAGQTAIQEREAREAREAGAARRVR